MNITYGNWIGTMNWDYFITIRRYYNWNQRGVRRVMDRIGNSITKSKQVERVFMVGERDFDDWNNFHLHLLVNVIDTTENEVEQLINKYFSVNDTKHIESVDSNTSVGIYLTKFIQKDVEYDIYFNT